MLTMVIMMMIILKTNNDDNACYREKVDGGDGHEQDEGGFHKGTPFTLSFTIPIKRTNVTMVFIFTGPRCLWGPVYGSRALYLCHYLRQFCETLLM